jgi:hypothetical protein
MKTRLKRTPWLPLAAIFFLIGGCSQKNGKFVRLESADTHIDFTNTITEDDSINIFDFSNIYNGGGVGVGDFNNDSLQDLYFTGNMVPNKLYLNKGNFEFEDITAQSKTEGAGRWSRGVSVIDINNDNKLDLYVCATAKRDPLERINLLYINQGTDKNNIPVFKEMAKEYGLADTTNSTMSYFFDYDNDSDLDLYIAVNHIIKDEYANNFRKRNLNGEHPSTGKLYRNDWDSTLKHGVFTDVSRQAGILVEGYSHAANIIDINEDGWQDIFVANDYISNNVLYINNRDGTFTDRVMEYFKHSAANSMGSDAIDLNNDGLDDIIEVDMAAKDNLRKKMFQPPNSYQNYQSSDLFNYQYQYVRNMIHVNQGPSIGQSDSIKHPVFSDLGYFAGVAETDWSWTPLVTDFDNDGNRDILFTNGFPKDITDRDFMAFRNEAYSLTPKKDMLAEIPAVKIPNYVYKNNGNFSFTDVGTNWGFNEPSFSNGAVYADLDNDGDMDVVINNIAHPAFVYRNDLYSNQKTKPHFLNIKFEGVDKNIHGIGAKVELHYGQGKQQVFRNTPYRGYISTVEQGVHFGLGETTIIDTVLIKWPDGKMQLKRDVKADQTLIVNYKNAIDNYTFNNAVFASNTLIENITDSIVPGIMHMEDDFIDFNVQKLLPHKLSDLGPGIAIGDINQDGLQDMVMAGSVGYSTQIITQQSNGRFISKNLIAKTDRSSKNWHDMGILLLDADGDSDLDLFVTAGGNEMTPNSNSYQDKFYINDGKGNFLQDSTVLPINTISKSCIRSADYDQDGDPDLFVAGRCMPWMFPQPVSSFIYRNDSKDGKIAFTDVTKTVAKELADVGLTCDALFTDFDNDGWQDLIITGEFMPVKFYKNNKGVFTLLSTSIDNQKGWWNSLTAGDFDNDGDMDYIAGNTGINTFYKASEQHPVRVYGKDFDNNGNFDAIPSLYLVTSQTDTTMKEYPANMRDDLIRQMIEFRSKFKTYNSLATSTFDKLLSKEQLKDAVIASANQMRSVIIKNEGNGKFSSSPLPDAAQVSTVFGMLLEDINEDGNLDLIICGNDFGTDVYVGRYDASNGLVLLGDGKGNFSPLTILQSGFFIPGNSKALVKLMNSKNQCLFIATQNRQPVKAFYPKKAILTVPANPDEVSCMVFLRDGKKRKEEIFNGSGYLSQSGRFINVNEKVQRLEFYDAKGNKRIVNF